MIHKKSTRRQNNYSDCNTFYYKIYVLAIIHFILQPICIMKTDMYMYDLTQHQA
jgi:hypothetical protein